MGSIHPYKYLTLLRELLYALEMGLKLFNGEKANQGGNLRRQRAGQSERWRVHPTETKYFRLLLH